MSGLGDLRKSWESQQSAYVAQREARFGVMLDVLGLALEPSFTVVDLACGPGSLALRVLERFPDATVIGVDHDPALLAVAADALSPFGHRAVVVDADILDPGWPEKVRAHTGGADASAVVSTTALHWLSAAQLVPAFTTIRTLLTDGGVFLDGDHLRYDGRTPRMREWARTHEAAHTEAAIAAGAPAWDTWWAELSARPGMAERVAERARRFAGRDPSPPTALDFRLAALGFAGFAEMGTAWQLFDDFVVYGVA